MHTRPCVQLIGQPGLRDPVLDDSTTPTQLTVDMNPAHADVVNTVNRQQHEDGFMPRPDKGEGPRHGRPTQQSWWRRMFSTRTTPPVAPVMVNVHAWPDLSPVGLAAPTMPLRPIR